MMFAILLIGDFIQLPVTTGRDLWSVMYGTVSGNDGTACELFTWMNRQVTQHNQD